MDYTQMTEPKKKKGKKKKEKDKPVAVSWHEFGKEEMVANELPTAPSEAPEPRRSLDPQREAFMSRSHGGSHAGPRPVSEADEASDWRSTMEPTARPVAKRPVTAPSSERALDEDWRGGNNMTSAPERVVRDTESNWRRGSEPTAKPPEKPREQEGPRNTESNWRMGSHPTKKPVKKPTKKPVKPVEPKIQRDYNRSWRRLS